MDEVPNDIRISRRSSENSSAPRGTQPETPNASSDSTVTTTTSATASSSQTQPAAGIQRIEILFPGFSNMIQNGQVQQSAPETTKHKLTIHKLLTLMDEDNSARAQPGAAGLSTVTEFEVFTAAFNNTGIIDVEDLLAVRDDIRDSGTQSIAQAFIDLLAAGDNVFVPSYMEMARILRRASAL
jgi:hypothetical protein